VIDAIAVIAGVRWFSTPSTDRATTARRAVTAMILIHALRVLVFVLGRTGPWVDFDVRPEYATTWTWFDVWFAGVGAAISLIVLGLVWQLRRRRSLRAQNRRSLATAARR
jgi:uncharacterized protein (TIGR03382 family)